MERTHFQFEGFVDVADRIMLMATTEKQIAERIRACVAEVLAEARSQMATAARSALGNDPRQAYRAVRRSVYRKLFGGQINIHSKRRGNASPVQYNKTRTLRDGQRGGNRIKPSARTQQVDNYFGSDRGFILRFVNAGTDVRQTRYGNRGSIVARNWFATAGDQTMQQAAERLAQMIDQEIVNVVSL